jgi:hypothetical protein
LLNDLHNQRAQKLDADGTALLPVCVNAMVRQFLPFDLLMAKN